MTDYTIQELIHNQSFRRMVQGTANAKEIAQWNRWIEASDKNRYRAKQAIAEIVGFEFKGLDSVDINKEWDRLHNTINNSHLNLSRYSRKKESYQWMYRVAAVVLIGALVGLGIYVNSNREAALPQAKQIAQARTIKTGPNEQKTLVFSNGSKIILNHNSTASYQTGMSGSQPIRVKLQGEAYFEAPEGSSEFAVYTPDGIIRDIGTKFLVSVKNDYSQVVLQAGKVEVNMKGSRANSPKITMTKGELLSFDQSHVLSKKEVNPTYYTSWATGFMHFDHTTIQKFAMYVEKKFNVKVKILNQDLKNIEISGSIYFKSLAGLVRSVSKVAGIHAYQSEDGKIVYLGKIN